MDKPVLETFEDFARFVSLSRRPGANKKPCIVSDEFYDYLTEGDTASPLFWKDNVPVVQLSRKDEGLRLLGGGDKIAPVIV
jgi:hypothetical protein